MMETLLQAFQMREATVESLAASGEVLVRDTDDAETACRLLQTADTPPPTLAAGDRVLVTTAHGVSYILGRVVPCTPVSRVAPPSSGRVVEIVVPDGVETVRISGKHVRIAADEELTLECAGGSVRIDKRGKVVVLGTDVTSRAKRLNKIKGASVAIN